jgi:hypothetical protein
VALVPAVCRGDRGPRGGFGEAVQPSSLLVGARLDKLVNDDATDPDAELSGSSIRVIYAHILTDD